MGASSTDRVRNVVLVGHGGAGKTPLAEAMLFEAGVTDRLGTVEGGHSNLDYDSEEIRRGITLGVSLAPIPYKDHLINVIDTPGDPDFIGDVIGGLEAAEMALFVVDAVAGPQVTTERIWHLAEKMQVARAVFVTRMDKENADFDATMGVLEDKFGHRVGAVQIPMGSGEHFGGIIDIIRKKAYRLVGEKEEIFEIPEEFKAAAEAAREKLLELVAEADDDLMEKYLEGEERLTQEELLFLLDKAIAQGIFIPVYLGSSIKMLAIQDLLDDIIEFFPAPTAHGPIVMADGSEVNISVDGEPAAFVFKTVSDPYVGRLSFVKVFSGTLSAGMELVNARTGKKERAAHLLQMTGKESKDVASVPAGGIAVLPKMLGALTGDTLSVSGKPEVGPFPYPESLYPVAVVARTKADEDKLGGLLNRAVEEDPTITYHRDDETKQSIITGMGDTHIDVLLARIKERGNVDVDIIDVRVPYRETIRKKAEAQGRHKKQTGGSGQFGDCWLRIEPNPGMGFEFLDEIVGGKIPRNFIPAVEKGVVDAMEEGVLAGYPMVDVKVAVFDGSYHAVDSNEMAFKTAARIGFRAACEKADMVLLEPMMELAVTIPETYAGAIMGDLPTRRGRVLGMDQDERGRTVVRAVAPYAEVVHYAVSLRSLSHGNGEFSMKAAGYEQVPHDSAAKIVAAAEAERANR